MRKSKTVKGLVNLMPSEVTVRVTKDKIGETLSLSDDKRVIIAIPMESVKDIIKLV